jgi:hypothetical protein
MPSMRTASVLRMRDTHGCHFSLESSRDPVRVKLVGIRDPGSGARILDNGTRIPHNGSRHYFSEGPRGSVAEKVPVNGTPIGPTGM